MDQSQKSVCYVIICELQMCQPGSLLAFPTAFDPHGLRRHVRFLRQNGTLDKGLDEWYCCWQLELLDSVCSKNTMALSTAFKLHDAAYVRTAQGGFCDKDQVAGLVYDFILKEMPGFDNIDPDMKELLVVELNSTSGSTCDQGLPQPGMEPAARPR